jgi:hypothetical protein
VTRLREAVHDEPSGDEVPNLTEDGTRGALFCFGRVVVVLFLVLFDIVVR